jgi:hypothetical protein
MEQSLLVALSALGGAAIGVFGQILVTQLNQRNRINFIKKESFFKKKIEYAEKTIKILEDRIRSSTDFYNILSKMDYKSRKNILSILNQKKLNEESPLYDNLSGLYFTKFTYTSELMSYLHLEKRFQKKVKELASSTNEDNFHNKIFEIKNILEEEIMPKVHDIVHAFRGELE